jgi:pimeloyl-ACP methyl ester carboxylesterase
VNGQRGVNLRTIDDLTLHGVIHEGPGDLGIVLSHGVTGSSERPAVQAVARHLATVGTVLSIDHRGHGRSEGRSTVGEREIFDVDATVAWLRAHGCTRVVSTGWSMGAGVVLRHDALVGEDVHGHRVSHGVDAIVHVSGTSRWLALEKRQSRWLLTMLGVRRPGHLVARRLGVRLSWPLWETFPLMPVEAAGRLGVRWINRDRAVPLLIVHGEDDGYFGVVHAQTLKDAAGDAAQLWIEPGFGHAEAGAAAHPDLLERLAARIPALMDRSPG